MLTRIVFPPTPLYIYKICRQTDVNDRERSATEQMRDESVVERVVRATNHVRAALLAGYTTYRDLGTESLGSADANLRDCINRGIIPGPRLFVATEALASNGSYEIRIENKMGGLAVPRASDPADGVNGVRAAVRRRVGEGADLIKFYADYRRKIMRFPQSQTQSIQFLPAKPNPAVPLYSQEEMDAIVKEAKLAELPVAAHAMETKVALMAARAGVTTIEHIFEDTHQALDELIEQMRRNRCIWVPTLATAEQMPLHMFQAVKDAVKKAHNEGVRLAAGGDTGTFNHGLNAREIEIMIEAGIPVEDALESCTVGGWEACGKDQCGFRFGWFEKGNRADIIALDTDPRKDNKALRKVSFVMKDGRIWKQDGVAVGMIPLPQWPSDDEDLTEGWTDLSITERRTVMTPFGLIWASRPSS
jgi:imidazolonepropionase-like amidohydrolase